MISQLRGTLVKKHPPVLVVDVQGVGYEVEAPMTTFYTLPEIGQPIHLYTHLVVRDDAHLLIGFATENERHLFRNLIKVNGVGVKMALAILSGIEADEFGRCIREGDTATLGRVPGVGPKTAERLVVEMRDRIKDLAAAGVGRAAVDRKRDDPVADAIGALIALGYKPQEASRHVNTVASAGLSSEEIIRQALKASIK